jgi:hypothetical protein
LVASVKSSFPQNHHQSLALSAITSTSCQGIDGHAAHPPRAAATSFFFFFLVWRKLSEQNQDLVCAALKDIPEIIT